MMDVREKERKREARLFYMKEDTMKERNSRERVYVSVCGWREVSGLSLLVLRSILA